MKTRKRLALLTAAAALLFGLCTALALQDQPARQAVGEGRIAHGAAGAIAYFASGSGPSVVLLPSFARTASDFNELAIALNLAGYRTLAVQPRGVGGSALGGYGATLHDFARDVVSVLKAENLAVPVAIVGHAFGNRVARAVAANFPGRVDRLVLLSAGGEVPTPPEAGRRVGIALFGFWSERARHQAISQAFFAEGQRVPAHWETGWYPLAGLIQTRAAALTPFAEWGDGGRAPVLIVQALSDRLAPPALAHRMLERHPARVTWREIEGAGHAMLPEKPDQIASELLAFLRLPP